MNKCKQCNNLYNSKDIFTEGYKDYCYNCGYKKATEDFKNFEQRRFEAELNQETPNFSDFNYEDIEDLI